jgi:hypothetical protein
MDYWGKDHRGDNGKYPLERVAGRIIGNGPSLLYPEVSADKTDIVVELGLDGLEKLLVFSEREGTRLLKDFERCQGNNLEQSLQVYSMKGVPVGIKINKQRLNVRAYHNRIKRQHDREVPGHTTYEMQDGTQVIMTHRFWVSYKKLMGKEEMTQHDKKLVEYWLPELFSKPGSPSKDGTVRQAGEYDVVFVDNMAVDIRPAGSTPRKRKYIKDPHTVW